MRASTKPGGHSQDEGPLPVEPGCAAQRAEFLSRFGAVPVVALDAFGIVTFWSPAAAEHFGRPAAEAVGHPAPEVLPLLRRLPAEAEGVLSGVSTSIWRGEVAQRDQDGEAPRFLLTIAPVTDSRAPNAGAVLQFSPLGPRLPGYPVSASGESARSRGLLASPAGALSAGGAPNDLPDRLPEGFVRIQSLGAALAKARGSAEIRKAIESGAWSPDPESARCRLAVVEPETRAIWLDEPRSGGERPGEGGTARSPIGLDAEHPLARVIRGGVPEWYPNGARLSDLAGELGIPSTSVALLPVSIRGEAAGALVFGFAQRQEFAVPQQVAMGAMGRLCGHTLEKASLLEAEQRARRATQAVLDTVWELASMTTQRRAAEVGLTHAARLLGSECGVLLLSGPSGSLSPAAFVGTEREPPAALLECPTVRDAMAGAEVALLSLGAPERPLCDAAAEAGVEWCVVCPVGVPGRCVGVMLLTSSAERRRPGADELGALRQIARGCAASLARTKSQEELASEALLRERLMAVLSHDIRQPLNVIEVSLAGLLRKGGLPDRATKTLERCVRASKSMDVLVRTLLDFSRVRSGQSIPVEPEPCDLAALVGGLVEDLRAANPAAPLELDVRGAPAGSWDPARVCEMVGNLVANAIRHGAEGKAVRVTAAREGGEAVITVRNEGPPIPAESLTSIFEPFRRARGATSKKGLGLGLYIVREIAKAHGGTVAVTSSPDEGTRFIVRLPLQPDPPEPQPAKRAP